MYDDYVRIRSVVDGWPGSGGMHACMSIYHCRPGTSLSYISFFLHASSAILIRQMSWAETRSGIKFYS
jgi:hypothetical protein